MAEPRHWHLVLYDVSDDKALRRVHRTLKDWGKPLQLSVFQVRCSARELERLRFELIQVMSEDDRLAIVRLCDGCAGRISVRGKPLTHFDNEDRPFKIGETDMLFADQIAEPRRDLAAHGGGHA